MGCDVTNDNANPTRLVFYRHEVYPNAEHQRVLEFEASGEKITEETPQNKYRTIFKRIDIIRTLIYEIY